MDLTRKYACKPNILLYTGSICFTGVAIINASEHPFIWAPTIIGYLTLLSSYGFGKIVNRNEKKSK